MARCHKKAIGDMFGETATIPRAGDDVHLENPGGWLLALQEVPSATPGDLIRVDHIANSSAPAGRA